MRKLVSILLLLAACSPKSTDNSPSDTDEANIGLNNQTGRVIAVTLSVAGKWNSGPIPVNNGAYVTRELGPTSAGDNILVVAVSTSGSPTVQGTTTCRPKSAMIGTTVYGQIDFALDGTVMFINCSSLDAWQ